MPRKLLYLLMFGSAVLVGCAGGGSGSGAIPPGTSVPMPTPTPTPPATTKASPAVPYATPVMVGSLNPLQGSNGNQYPSSQTFVQDLTGSGAQNVIVATAQSSGTGVTSNNYLGSAISVYGWSGGQLVNQTAQWLPNNSNIIVGTNNILFGNFNGSGRPSMYVGPFTDNNTNTSQAEIFVNSGSSFIRYNIDLPYKLSSPGSTTFMYNGVENIVAVSDSNNTTFIFGSTTNQFRAVNVNNLNNAGSAIAAGDFLGNGTTTFVITDDNNCSGTDPRSTRLYNWNLNQTTGAVSMNMIGILPPAILDTAQFDSYFANYPKPPGINLRSNNIGIVKYDFDESGVPSVVLLDMPTNYSGPLQSAVQFLKNNGTGTFTDVTSTVLTGYNYNKSAATISVVDLLNNGLPDIVLSGAGGVQVLMQVSRGQYVASFANVITSFQNQVASLQNGAGIASVVNFVQGPGGQLYLLDMVDSPTNMSQKNLYLSALGSSSSVLNATQTITAIKQQWPWMTNAEANAVLAATGQTWFGATVINETAVFSPSGSLSIDTAKGAVPIRGNLGGVELSVADTQLMARDTLGRTWTVDMSGTQNVNYSNSFNADTEHIDQYDLTSHTEYLINGAVGTYGAVRLGTETRNAWNTWGSVSNLDPDARGRDNLGPVVGPQPINYTVGVPGYWHSQDHRWTAGAQYTTLNYNPWVSLSGSWGLVTQTSNWDQTLRYQGSDGFSAVAGVTYTTTTMQPGLITSITPILGAWGEAGQRWGNLGVYAGVKPVLLSGSVAGNLPTGVDGAGNTVYTQRNLAIQNSVTGYVRGLWNADINRSTSYRVSGTVMSNGQYRVMNELWMVF